MNVPAGPAFLAGRWDSRIARARSLAADASPASAILSFYAGLAELQKRIASNAAPSDLRGAADAAASSIADLLQWLRGHAPVALASVAAGGRARPVQEWKTLLDQRIEAGESIEDGPTAFIIEAALQPFAERAALEKVRLPPSREALRRAPPELAVVLSSVGGKPDPTYGSRCPLCMSLPVVAVLREEGQGARRSLVCGLCFNEWDYLRIQCPSCKENRFEALPVYTADAPANARIDACDSCRTYIKTVDLTKDGLAVPVVDDLATLSLDLWARDRGYQRFYPNLLRL